MMDLSAKANENYFIKPGYRIREAASRVPTPLIARSGIIHYPQLYPFAAHLARRYGCSHLISVGCTQPDTFVPYRKKFNLIGLDSASTIAHCRQIHPSGQWLEWDFNTPLAAAIDRDILRDSIIICADVIEHSAQPDVVLDLLQNWLDDAPAALLCATERDLARGAGDLGPPAHPCHVREWNRHELEELLHSCGFRVEFTGLTVNTGLKPDKTAMLAVLGNNRLPEKVAAPPDYRVVMVVNVYNEADIMVPTLNHYAKQGVEVYVIDDWSTDSTLKLAQDYIGRGVSQVERFPSDRPSTDFDLFRQMSRVEELSRTLKADWMVHFDIDELRESPWPGVNLRDALYYVDRCGFNAIDHTLINFQPVDNGYQSETDFGAYFPFYEPGTKHADFIRINGWKLTGQPISLAKSAGHRVEFPGQRVFPYNFLLRHYPIRSQSHGEQKAEQRRTRANAEERAKGWNRFYDHMGQGYVFLRDPAELLRFDPETYYTTMLVERLSRVGIPRETKYKNLFAKLTKAAKDYTFLLKRRFF